MQTITVYSKPEGVFCGMCESTKKWLKNRSVEFTEKRFGDDDLDLEAAKFLNQMSAPVVLISQGTPKDEVLFSGFRPDLLEKHVVLPDAA